MKKFTLFSLLYVCCVVTYAKDTVYSATTEAPLDDKKFTPVCIQPISVCVLTHVTPLLYTKIL